MALVTILNEDKTITERQAIAAYLNPHGIDYEHWTPAHPVAPDAPPEEILRAYAKEIDELKARGGYVTADVIDVKPETPGLDAMLKRFSSEHWHDEDEVRLIVDGRGLFHIHPRDGAGFALEVTAGEPHARAPGSDPPV